MVGCSTVWLACGILRHMRTLLYDSGRPDVGLIDSRYMEKRTADNPIGRPSACPAAIGTLGGG